MRLFRLCVLLLLISVSVASLDREEWFIAENPDLINNVCAILQTEAKGKLSDESCRAVTAEIVSGWKSHGIPPGLVLAIIHQESRFNPAARSKKGAVGLMQLMPATAKPYVGVPVTQKLLDPATNVRAGVTHLADLHALHGTPEGGYSRALSAYLRGTPTNRPLTYSTTILNKRDYYDSWLLTGERPNGSNSR